MAGLVGRAPGHAVLGFILAPIIALLAVLVMGFVFDSSCRAGTDSGGCAMGAMGAAIYAAIPGALAGLAFGIWRSLR